MRKVLPQRTQRHAEISIVQMLSAQFRSRMGGSGRNRKYLLRKAFRILPHSCFSIFPPLFASLCALCGEIL